MDKNQQKLSDYIDKLNAEKKPDENIDNSSELGEIFETVRQIRSLNDPELPESDFPKKLAYNIKHQLPKNKNVKKKKYIWLGSLASVAAVLVIAIMINFNLPPGGINIIYAMEQAYKEVEAYHGILEIVQTNAEGDKNTQTKFEVWTDKDGKYYIKGLEGSYKGLTTVNNGEKKWQIRPEEKQMHVFSAFPDSYRFIFELGKEIEGVKNAITTKEVGEGVVVGRESFILEVSPQGGVPYKIWIDKETNLPLQKQYEMQKALQYTITYTDIDFISRIPDEYFVYEVPKGFDEVNVNAEQIITDIEEAEEIVGFIPKTPKDVPTGYILDSISVVPNNKLVKFYYTRNDKNTKVVIIQGKSEGVFNPSPTAILGEINSSVVEIQSPVTENLGILGGGGVYAGVTDITSIRWQEDELEYAVVGNDSVENLGLFAKSFTNGILEISSIDEEASNKPQIEVPVDLEVERSDQNSVDTGSSPWKLDPVYVAQVFVSLEISPEGITGEYPIKYENLKVIQNDGKEAVIKINEEDTPIIRVYLKRLIRQDSTGIWTVVGYDPVNE